MSVQDKLEVLVLVKQKNRPKKKCFFITTFTNNVCLGANKC